MGGARLMIETPDGQPQRASADLERFIALAGDLTPIVRDEIRAAAVEEFQALGQASRQAAQALDGVRRAASLRLALWAIGVVACCSVIPLAVVRTVLPTRAELERLRGERDALEARVAQLAQRGGRIDLRRCGTRGRLCVRVERSAPVYGADGDYYVLKGY